MLGDILEPGQIMIILGVVLVLVIAIVFWPFGAKPTNTNNQAGAVGTTPGGAVQPVTTTTPAVISFYAVNLEYIYSGPSQKSGQNCYYNSFTNINGQQETVNGSQVFILKFQPSSNQCGMTITNISMQTAGFGLVNILPVLPINLPPNSQIQMQLNVRAPSTSFYGPLTVMIHYQ